MSDLRFVRSIPALNGWAKFPICRESQQSQLSHPKFNGLLMFYLLSDEHEIHKKSSGANHLEVCIEQESIEISQCII